MKPIIIALTFCAATLIAVLSTVALNRPGPVPRVPSSQERTFEVAGKVTALDPGSKTVRIAHESIPEYMPAMTMPFSVEKASLLNDVRIGDQVQFQLVVNLQDSWIAKIHKVKGDIASVAQTHTKETNEPTRVLEHVQVGEKLPDFALVDQNGRALRLSNFRGKAVLLTFIYTRCPLPNFCPLMSKNFSALQERLSKSLAGQFHLLSVSIDPEFDQPAILKSYALRYAADEKSWSFATGTTEQIDLVVDSLGLTREPENGFIAHDLRTALISPDGRLVHVWKSNVWTPYEVERQVREMLGESPRQVALH